MITERDAGRRWEPRGGKSNSFFAKTRDDRFIVKQLSQAERVNVSSNFVVSLFFIHKRVKFQLTANQAANAEETTLI